MASLTDRQREVLDCLRAFVESQGWAPTLRELAVLAGVSSTNAIAGHLDALERKGYIARRRGRARAIRIVEGSP